VTLIYRLGTGLIPALILLFGLTAAAGPNVLLLWDDAQGTAANALNPNTLNLIAGLESEGVVVTLSARPQQGYTGFNPPPETYDVLIHLNGFEDVFKVMPASGAAALVDYVERGGGILTSENTSAQLAVPENFGGLSQIMTELMPFQRNGGRGPAPITVTKVGAVSNHPVLQNLPSSFTFTSGRLTGQVRTYADDPAVMIMQDELGNPAVVIRQLGAGRVVSMHNTGNFSDGTTLSDPNIKRLYLNAILWADTLPPIALEITRAINSTVLNASTAPFNVRFREGVRGLDANDFEVATTQSLNFSGVQVQSIDTRTYSVNVTGLTGQGTVTLNLRDNDSITDRSYNLNPLGGEGTGNGAMNGPAYTVDGQPPRLVGFVASELIVPVNRTPILTFIFNELMKTSTLPSVVITTLNNGAISASPLDNSNVNGARISDGLLALYPFNDGSGSLVRDVSGVGTPMNLTIGTPGAIAWQNDVLVVSGSTLINSTGAADKIINGAQATNEISMEAWIRPANLTQAGPARIVSISEGTGSRNLTLGQDLSRYEGRVRTTATSENGIPSVATEFGEAEATLQHVLYTRDASGNVRIYLDGELNASGTVTGDFSNWSPTQPLLIGNELSGNRPWFGELHLIALYNRALTPAEVAVNFDAGPVLPESPGTGRWLDNRTWQVAFDRAVVPADAGSAVITIAGAEDLSGNVMSPDSSRNIGLVQSTMSIRSQPPVFDYAEAGSKVTFRVEITGGVGDVTFEWFKQDQNMNLNAIGPDAPELVIPAVDFDDSGTYVCVVSDVQRVVQTDPATLQVVEALPISCRWCYALAGILMLLIGCRALNRRNRSAS
jgi:hypothetical protein